MYAEYVKERLNYECFETEKGFATYRYLDGETVYIVDIFVLKEFRKEKVASDMADKIVEIAKAQGCKKLIGTVVPSANGSTESVKVLLGYGMKVESASTDLIVFKKEI